MHPVGWRRPPSTPNRSPSLASMSPSIIGQAEFDALVTAVQPSDGELIEVKRQLVQRLRDGGAHPVSELNAGVLTAFGVPPLDHGQQQHYDVPRDVHGGEAIDRDAVPIKRQRLMYAVKLVTAELVAEG